MSHTNVRTNTKIQRARGRGQGRIQRNRNNNSGNNTSHSSNPNIFQAEYNQNLHSSSGDRDWTFLNNPTRGHSNRGNRMFNGSNRSRGNFKNHFKGEHPKRSHSSSSTSSSIREGHSNVSNRSANLASDKFTPSHVQNPIFLNYLQEKFNDLLPKSALLSTTGILGSLKQPDLSVTEDPTYKTGMNSSPAQNSFEDGNETFASISNNISYGFRNRGRNQESSIRARNGSGTNKKPTARSRNYAEQQRSNFSVNAELDFTKGVVAGSANFSFNRAVADVNERVPTRAEALQRIQFEYERQRQLHEVKAKEKEAKKRDEYLAKYKHVDQGFRFNEPMQGYVPYNISQEEARIRQQMQLQEEILFNQHREREKLHQERKKEEEKQKKWLNKHQHIDAGYRLGDGKYQGVAQQPRIQTQYGGSDVNLLQPQQEESVEPMICKDFLLEGETMEEALIIQEEQLMLEALIYNENPQKSSKKEEEIGKEKGATIASESDKKTFSEHQNILDDGYLDEAAGFATINSDNFLLEGESMDEALFRQQEQLLKEAREKYKEDKNIYNSVKEDYKGIEEESSTVQSNQRRLKTCLRKPPHMVNQKLAANSLAEQNNNINVDTLATLPAANGVIHTAKKPEVCQEINENHDEEAEDIEKEKQRLLARLELLMSKSSGMQQPKDSHTTKPVDISKPIKPADVSKPIKPADVSKPIKPADVSKPIKPADVSKPIKPADVSKFIKPAGCILQKNTSGPLLILRSNEDDLKKALTRLKLQDELDKHGITSVCNAQKEQEPLNSSNGLEYNPQVGQVVQAMGAASTPKLNHTTVSKPVACSLTSEPVSNPAAPTKTPDPEEPAIDYQAELRAARLRMQQKYEESLKKQKENAQ